ncbi:glycosyltransferase family 4 protein [Streptococcus uberis]|uniref:glycosyltransferase family 4 protein n=1 Tax=Streptococcus uberis TaxID=1349 RepID=UPI003892C3EA
MKILYLENVASIKATNFYSAAAKAAAELKYEFHLGYNAQDRTNDDIKYLKKSLNVIFHQINFFRFPFHPLNIIALIQVIKLIKKEQIDIIHCNTPTGGIIGRIAGIFSRDIKIIYQAHGFHFSKETSFFNWITFYPVEKLLSYITDVIITINMEDFALAKRHFYSSRTKIFYVPGVGIDKIKISKIVKNNNREKVRKELGLDRRCVALVSIGELNKNKNNEVIIKSMFQMNNKHYDFKYFICGSGKSENKLKRLVNELGLTEKVSFLGYKSNVIEILASCDIFLLPSYREGLSRSLMEAMAVGVPCIVSNIRGNRDLVINDQGGYLCDPNNSSEFMNAILILKSEEKRNSMASFNQKFVEDFSIDIVKNKIKEIYLG